MENNVCGDEKNDGDTGRIKEIKDHFLVLHTKHHLMSLIYRFIFFVLLPVVSCNQATLNDSPLSKSKIFLKIRFEPAFEEKSEAMLMDSDNLRTFQSLIKNNFRIDSKEDTFF